jgi:hypothetical protein
MKTRLIPLGLAQALVFAGACQVEAGEYALEPCINGGVSSTGLFASQAEEDRQLAERRALALEPCFNGAVSARGFFPNQVEEDQSLRRLASK